MAALDAKNRTTTAAQTACKGDHQLYCAERGINYCANDHCNKSAKLQNYH